MLGMKNIYIWTILDLDKSHWNTLSFRAKVTVYIYTSRHIFFTYKENGKKSRIVSCLDKQYITYVLELIFPGHVRSLE